MCSKLHCSKLHWHSSNLALSSTLAQRRAVTGMGWPGHPPGAKPRGSTTNTSSTHGSPGPFVRRAVVLAAPAAAPAALGAGSPAHRVWVRARDAAESAGSCGWEPRDSAAAAAARRALAEWAEYAQECRMKRAAARSTRVLRRNLPAERMLRCSVAAWARATVGRTLATAHAMRQLVCRVLPRRRRRAASRVLRFDFPPPRRGAGCRAPAGASSSTARRPASAARELVRRSSWAILLTRRASASLAAYCTRTLRCDVRAGCSSQSRSPAASGKHWQTYCARGTRFAALLLCRFLKPACHVL